MRRKIGRPNWNTLPLWARQLVWRYRRAVKKRDQAKKRYTKAQTTLVRACQEAGMSVRDTAHLIGISPARVHQLRKGSPSCTKGQDV